MLKVKDAKNSDKKKLLEINWMSEPEEHNYPAAASYLGLMFDDEVVQTYVDGLKKAPMSSFKSKDIFRASGLSLLGVSNSHVAVDQAKILKGKPISPLLLVRDPKTSRVIIADGYHRLCAIYSFDEDADIPCKIV